eukprot:1834400-Alexandrium_andersonii.AAC.1
MSVRGQASLSLLLLAKACAQMPLGIVPVCFSPPPQEVRAWENMMRLACAMPAPSPQRANAPARALNM